MTASSPCTEGMIETRKSIERPPIFTRKRPSWGTRFSAMSSSDMTLMRLMIVAWCSLAIGFIAGCSTPSIRYLITTSLSRVSMWMSEARRLRASKTVESTRRMIGDWSAWILSIDRTSSPFSSSRSSWILNDSEACSRTRCVPWPRLSASWIAGGRARPRAGSASGARGSARPPPGCRWGRPSPAPAARPRAGTAGSCSGTSARPAPTSGCRGRGRTRSRPRTRAGSARRARGRRPPRPTRRARGRPRRPRPIEPRLGHRLPRPSWTAEMAWNIGR